MTLITPKLPYGAKILFNSLHDTKQPSYLTDDLFAAELPGGVFVDVGWFPECDPNGSYEVCVYKASFENQLSPPFETKDVRDASAAVERFANIYGREITAVVFYGGSVLSPRPTDSDSGFDLGSTSSRNKEFRRSLSFDKDAVTA
jgi:hypothetical protein